MGNCGSIQPSSETNGINQNGIQPVSKENQRVSSRIKPLSRKTQPVSREIQPVSKESEAVSKENQLVSNESQPVSKERQPVSRETPPVSRENQPVSKESQLVSKENQSVSRESQQVSKENQPVSRENQPVSKESQLVSKENQSVSRESQQVSKENQPVSRENQPVFREPPLPSVIFKKVIDSRIEGGIAFSYDWRKRNATLSNNEIIIQAANGIIAEGQLLDKKHEANILAQRLLDVQDKSESEILQCCIYLYTLESFLYKLVNTVLRENDKTKMDTVAPFCYFLTEAIWSNTLADERFYGLVYRAMKFDHSTINHYKEAVGTYKCWYGFNSTSISRKVAEHFGNCLFIIDISATGGLTISKYSEYPDENEVILPPGTTLRIDNIVHTEAKIYIYVFAVPECRMVLLGSTGSGKSSFGNAILGKEQFEAIKSAISVTKKCGVSDRILNDARLRVVDTPGFFDTDLTPAQLMPEIYSSYQVAAPGPHVFLIVFSLNRFTPLEKAVVKWICKVFDERALDYCIIVFTGLDGIEKENTTIEKYLQKVPQFLTDLLAKCNDRYIAVDNTASDDKKEEKNETLLKMILTMVKKNGGQFYNNKSFIQMADTLMTYPDWFDPVKSDGTVNLVQEAANIVAPQLNANAIFTNQ